MLRSPIEGRNVIEGVIGGAEAGTIRIELEGGGTLSVPFAEIARARLVI